MREGYSEHNSENPSDSVLEADDDFALVFSAIEDILREVKNGHKRTFEDSNQDLLLACDIFLAAEKLVIDEWTPRLAAARDLLENTADLMRREQMPDFAKWFENKIREIDVAFVQTETPETEPLPTVVIVEPPNSNHLLDWPLR